MNDNKKYTTIADLLTDDGFLAWHLKKPGYHHPDWNKWMAEKPENAVLASQAVHILSVLINLKEKKMSDYQINAAFDRLFKKMLAANRKNVINVEM